MSEKEERFLIYLTLFAGAVGVSDSDLSFVERLQYGVIVIASIKLLNRFLKWFDDWRFFLASIILSNLFLRYVFFEYWGYYFAISLFYTIAVFASTYSGMKSHNKEYARFQNDSGLLPEYRTRTFAQHFTHWSKELQEKYK